MLATPKRLLIGVAEHRCCTMQCRYCESTEVRKNGKRRGKHASYLYRTACGRQFIESYNQQKAMAKISSRIAVRQYVNIALDLASLPLFPNCISPTPKTTYKPDYYFHLHSDNPTYPKTPATVSSHLAAPEFLLQFDRNLRHYCDNETH